MSSSLKLFITGVTGYIGGDVFHAIVEKYPHLEVSSRCLVRSPESGRALEAAYPSVDVVYGDLSDSDLLESAAADADIVLHCADIEDPKPSQALARGLARRERPGPAFWICASGTDNLGWQSIEKKLYGEPLEAIYDDIDGVDAILALPAGAPHRDVEAVQQAAASPQVKVAIVSAPCVYGRGRGCGNQRSIQLPNLVQYTLQHGKAFQVGRGLSRWPNVHIQDLSDIFLRLVDNALDSGGVATWGCDGYYFAENGEHVWGQTAKLVAEEVQRQGFTAATEVVSWSPEEADQHLESCVLFYGTDARCRARRAREVLGWLPRRHRIEEEITITVATEAKKFQA